jgi:NAD(P)-dependent dehydrogenase (short-subunit alcohol dehydrogenase family)
LHLEVLETLAVLFRKRSAFAGPPMELMLLVDQGVDPPDDVVVVHIRRLPTGGQPEARSCGSIGSGAVNPDLTHSFAGRVALVTGASRGVGAATALALAQAGCAVACAARSTASQPQRTPGTLDDTVARIEEVGGTALAIPTDLADEEQVVAMVKTTVERFGRLDVVVNNAAITFAGDLDIPARRYDLIMAVNLRAPWVAMREAAPHLQAAGGGSIVNVSSAAALYPYPTLTAYGVSKAGLERLTVDGAHLMAPAGTAVNCFRIDIPVASEGFVANTPGLDRSSWEPPEVAAEGIMWVLAQPATFSGQLLSMWQLRQTEGIMASRAERPAGQLRPPLQLVTGLANALPE